MTSYSFFIPFPSFSLSTLPCVLYIFIEGVWRVLHTSCGWGDFLEVFFVRRKVEIRTTNNKRNQFQEKRNLTGTMSGNWNKERRYNGLREEGSLVSILSIEV